MEDSSHRGQGR